MLRNAGLYNNQQFALLITGKKQALFAGFQPPNRLGSSPLLGYEYEYTGNHMILDNIYWIL